MRTIVAVERRRRPISSEAWADLQEERDFWNLHDQGIVRVRQQAIGAELEGTSYVGRAMFGNVLLKVEEKIPGALAALLGYATFDAFRLEVVESPSSDLGPLLRLLVGVFVQRAREYVGRGIDWSYGWKRESGSLIAGRLDVPGTIKLRTLGRRDQASFARPVIDQNQPFNRILLAALREVERIAQLIEIAPADLSRARGVTQYLGEARTAEVLFGARSDWCDQARDLSESERDEARRDLASLATVILSRESFELDATDSRASPRSWFLNLETLFEEAARRQLRKALPKCAVSRSSRPPIFRASSMFRADPDVVVREQRGGQACLAVADVKYKDWQGTTSEGLHSDLYQLLVHAAAFEAPAAVLLFPDDHFDVRHIGTSVTGCDAWAFAVNIHDLAACMVTVADLLALS